MTRPNLTSAVANLHKVIEWQAELQCQQTEVLNRHMEHFGCGALPLPPLPPVEAHEQEGDGELLEFPDVYLEADAAHPKVVAFPAGDPREQERAAVYPNPVVDAPYPAGYPVQGTP